MEKENKHQKEETFFSSLPKVLKEEIFVFLGDTKEIGRLRGVSKTFKELIDKSNRKEIQQVKKQREQYFSIMSYQEKEEMNRMKSNEV